MTVSNVCHTSGDDDMFGESIHTSPPVLHIHSGHRNVVLRVRLLGLAGASCLAENDFYQIMWVLFIRDLGQQM